MQLAIERRSDGQEREGQLLVNIASRDREIIEFSALNEIERERECSSLRYCRFTKLSLLSFYGDRLSLANDSASIGRGEVLK